MKFRERQEWLKKQLGVTEPEIVQVGPTWVKKEYADESKYAVITEASFFRGCATDEEIEERAKSVQVIAQPGGGLIVVSRKDALYIKLMCDDTFEMGQIAN